VSLDGVLRILLASCALVGHVLLWIEFINHSHATRMPRWGVWALTLFGFGALGFGPLAFIVLWWLGAHETAWRALYPALQYYAILCIVSAGVLGPLAVFHRRRKRLRNAEQLSAVSYEFGQPLGLRIDGRRVERWLNYLPGNEVFHLEVTHKRLTIDGLPPELDGLRLCHLTDLHYTGRIPRRFFDEVVEQANALAPDLTLLTGDIVDKSPCIDWLAPTLGKLRAVHGCYYILGNHDKRVPIDRLRAEIERCGLKSVSHRTLTLDVRGATILLAGNELPWLPPAANMKQGALLPGERPHLRLLLSHSPDQFAWARAYAFDLMLAGHNHGGQIAFPWIGPVFVPSRYGVKYASGLFYEAPTLLHVSRGVSSELPARLRCPPEVALLELRR
jgi:predicted MPP superfamily phosphohydrolase